MKRGTPLSSGLSGSSSAQVGARAGPQAGLGESAFQASEEDVEFAVRAAVRERS